MRVVAISDTHNGHWGIDIPDGDLLIHAGDMTTAGTARELFDFGRWLARLPHRHKLVVPGNHDYLFEQDLTAALHILEQTGTGARVLIEDEVTIEGRRIWGSPYTPAYHGCFGYEPDQAFARWTKMPNDLDMAITHGPPLGVMDLTTRGVQAGCPPLLGAVLTARPRCHLFGHIHESRGVVEGTVTTFINAAMLDRHYQRDPAFHEPVLIDL